MDKQSKGPDHWFSADPHELSEWVKNIRSAEVMLGNPIIEPTKAELLNKKEFQRVLVASVEINCGDIFTENNLEMRRVSGGFGMRSNMYSYLLGRKAWKNFEKLEPIEI